MITLGSSAHFVITCDHLEYKRPPELNNANVQGTSVAWNCARMQTEIGSVLLTLCSGWVFLAFHRTQHNYSIQFIHAQCSAGCAITARRNRKVIFGIGKDGAHAMADAQHDGRHVDEAQHVACGGCKYHVVEGANLFRPKRWRYS